MVIADTTVDPGDPTNWCASTNLMGSPGEDEPQACPTWFDPTEAVFEPGRLLDVRILLDAENFETLRLQERNLFDLLGDEDCLAEPFGSPFTYFPGSITVDGVPVEQVGVRKKGFLGSLSRGKPSLKVKFDEYVDGQRLSGLRRMTLNNAQQDPSYINQCLGYQLFSAAGVPAPRCNFAVVTVNDEPLGVYVHVESVRTRFLALHFDQNTGDLYEGTLSDFRPGWTGTFELKDDGPDAGGSILEDMVAALDAPDDELVETLEGLIDLDAFLTFWAMEVLVGHWDGYAGNTNNFFVYHDPTDDQLNFMPWGADALFGGGQGAPAVAATSALARRLYL
jgi:spore coat protein CotH